MNKKCLVPVLGALAVISAIIAPGAAAATEFGDNCVGNEATAAEVEATLFSITASGDPLPLTAPSAGIITKWKVNQAALPFGVPQTLKVLRIVGPKSVQVSGESAQTVASGSNSFDTRIPVQVGDRLGLSAPSKSPLLFCKVPGPMNLLGIFAGAPAGSTVPFEEIEAEARVPVSAVIEPDADNDGYGDETQDKCPQVTAVQAPCPVVTLSARPTAKKGLVTVLVTTSSQASVTVAGKVSLGKGKTAKLNGGTQVVAPGTIAKFTLPFSKKLRTALKQLPTKRSLSLRLTATAPNLVGAATIRKLKVKLQGQAKPKRHKKP